MPRPVQLYMLTDMRNAHLRSATLDITGRAGNGSPQGTWIVAARTKVRAAEIASELFDGPIRPTALRAVTSRDAGNSVAWVVSLRLITPTPTSDETALCWRRDHDGDPIVRYDAGKRDTPEVVAHWRRTDADGLVPVLVGVDPTLRPTRQVMVPAPEETERWMDKNLTRDEYPGAVALYSDGRIWVGGIGTLDRARATELMESLAGAITDAERREQAPS